MTLTNTNKIEVLFEELSQEDTAMITGGVTITASASAQFSSPTQTTLTAQKPITDVITKLSTSDLGLNFPINIQSDELTRALQTLENVKQISSKL